MAAISFRGQCVKCFLLIQLHLPPQWHLVDNTDPTGEVTVSDDINH